MPPTISFFDELPLWSAVFGKQILDAIPLRRGMRVLDLGSGLGFPLLEIAERSGAFSFSVGLDPWREALGYAEKKRVGFQIEQAAITCGAAESMPFPDSTFDLVVSNNGVNNVQDIDRSFAECARVLRSGGELYLTVNLPGTMREFYDAFGALLVEEGLEKLQTSLRMHIDAKRKPAATTIAQVRKAGFEVGSVRTGDFPMRFLDGSSFFRHHLIRWAFLPPWEEVVPKSRRQAFFEKLEARLNWRAAQHGGLSMTIPWMLLSARRR